jgi:hypothetical protein
MADKNDKRSDSGWLHENDDLGRELDAAVAKYAAAEPRAGLEERILENLRAEKTHARDRAWWGWAIAGAMAIIVVMVALAWRSVRPSQPMVANRPKATVHDSEEPRTQVTADENSPIHKEARAPIRGAIARPTKTSAVSGNNPKLDQFPSPQPLSEQEKILARYVNQYPEHASLIAQARMEMLRRDREEELRETTTDSTQDSQPQ